MATSSQEDLDQLYKTLQDELGVSDLGFSSQESFNQEWEGIDRIDASNLFTEIRDLHPTDGTGLDQVDENVGMTAYTTNFVNSTQDNIVDDMIPYTDYDVNYNNAAVPDTTQGHGIPSNTNWLGEYNFEISFQEQTEKMTKSTSWTYSEQMDKLFVNMGVSCIVCFRVKKLPPPGCIIRALPIFEKCDHIRDVVKRCPTHCLRADSSNKDHTAPEHLVRCESEKADYVTDNSDGRQSVIVPFLPPQAGTDSTQYLYKFMCLGSCVGGLNRRPLQLIFTLEHKKQVLGRRTLKVRICACPGRDRKSEENALLDGPAKKVKYSVQSSANDSLVFEPASKRQKFDEELFTLTIQGRANYEILLKVKESLELADLVPKETLQAYRMDQEEIRKVVESIPKHKDKNSSKKMLPPKKPKHGFGQQY